MFKKTVSQAEFKKFKSMVMVLAGNQSKIMEQVNSVQKELRQTIDLLQSTNEMLKLQMDVKKFSSDLNAS